MSGITVQNMTKLLRLNSSIFYHCCYITSAVDTLTPWRSVCLIN